QFLSRASNLGDCHLGRLDELQDGAQVVVPVGIAGLRPYTGGRGTMAFVQVEDLHGQAEMVCFAKVYEAAAEHLHADVPLLVAARVDRSKDEPVLIAEAIAPLEPMLNELVDEIDISAASIAWDEMTLARLKSMAQGGNARLAFHVRLPDASIAHLVTGPCIAWSESVKAQLDARFGQEAVRIHCRPWQPPRKQQVRRGSPR
ncbi:MAG: DNA polymerase III subunit alpha, partial [Mariprofundaceae bacterium]